MGDNNKDLSISQVHTSNPINQAVANQAKERVIIKEEISDVLLGVGGNMFKLAGSVILFGVFSAFIVALIKTILIQWGGL